jgi:hypothetical protein
MLRTALASVACLLLVGAAQPATATDDCHGLVFCAQGGHCQDGQGSCNEAEVLGSLIDVTLGLQDGRCVVAVAAWAIAAETTSCITSPA